MNNDTLVDVHKNINDIRKQLTNITLISLILFLLPLMFSSCLQLINHGWQPFMTLQIISYLILLFALIFQRIIVYKVRAGIIVLTLYLIGARLLFTWGLAAGSGMYFIYATILGVILFEKIIGVTLLTAGIITLSSAGIFSVAGYLPVTDSSLVEYSHYYSSWISYIVIFATGTCIITFSLKTIYYILSANIKKLIKNNKKLLNLNSQLNLEIIKRKKLEKKIKKHLNTTNKILDSTIEAINTIVEDRDKFITGHQEKVAFIATAIAKELKLNSDITTSIRLAARLHDIGKIYIPQKVLNKPERFTQTEYELIKTHVEKGRKVLSKLSFPWDISKIISQHHERINGSGYPLGLKGNEITIEAKIIALADVIDAMLCSRPYRNAYNLEEVITEIKSKANILFDSAAVDASINLLRDKIFVSELSSIKHYSNRNIQAEL